MIFGKYINKYYLRYGYLILLGVIALLAVDYMQLKIPDVYGTIIDGLRGDEITYTSIVSGKIKGFFDADLLKILMKDMFIILCILVIGRFAWRVCFFNGAILVESKIRNQMFDHCKDLSQEFYSKNKVGNLMSLFTNDLDTINECFGDGLLYFFDCFALGALAIYRMFSTHILLTFLALIPAIIMVVMGFLVGKYIQKKWEARQEAFSKLSDFAQESFSGIAVIKAFVKEAKELAEFKKINKTNENANVTYVKYSTLLHVLITLFIQSIMCVILGYGGYLAYTKVFSVGTLIKFISYFNSLIWPLMALAFLIDMGARGRASLKRISNLLDTPIDIQDGDDVLTNIDHIDGNIRFNHLTFTYPGTDYTVLNDVSFEIKQGENVGLIGRTGSGKTSIVDLILRTYKVDDNTIFIDEHDINKIPIKVLRNFCAYVPQNNFLFSDTIENNISFAFDELDEQKVKYVSELSDVHRDISEFEHGYKTVLGERGVTVSGGQKQRISIARALAKEASILILDDSVSAVDTKTEASIINNLKETRKNKTTILIAHRVTTIEKMDKIIYIDDGKIIDVGTHDELYSRCKEYRNMVELQRLEDEKGGND